ncbi:MAG: hypothetical protein JF606_17915 [Burkholderiales bacterium]|nr:hypothetical protein [Burkholderiales bacterium]
MQAETEEWARERSQTEPLSEPPPERVETSSAAAASNEDPGMTGSPNLTLPPGATADAELDVLAPLRARSRDTGEIEPAEETLPSIKPRTAAGASKILPTTPVPAARRQTLLQDYHAQAHRPLDLEQALAAIKLRHVAEVYCEKNEWSRLKPHLPLSHGTRQRFEELAGMPVDALVADVQAHPARYSRTLLTDLAQHHLVAALNIDVELFKKGIHQAAKYEGLHSVAGRVMTAAAAVASAGISDIAGASHALKVAKKAVKVIAHQLPSNVVNPMLTGKLRTATDVKESFKRVGGQPVVASQIENSPDMASIVKTSKLRRRELRDAVDRLKAASSGRDPKALGQVVDAILALHDVADQAYRRRIGLNRTQTYSKGWGMAVNGVAATGAVVTATVPVVGQIAGPSILAATIAMQWGAGYLDERRVKHWYNLRANTKWADFLTKDAARIHFKDLQPGHVCEAALRRSFMTQPEVQIGAIREVYEDALGELMRMRVKLEDAISAQQRASKPAPELDQKRERLQKLQQKINRTMQDAKDFESFDGERWDGIPADSTIGRCLDDLEALERANRNARFRKPGETAQIVQRYSQAFHGGVSTGVALPILDAITLTDRLYEHDYPGNETKLNPNAEIGAVAAGVTGGAVFTAATGEVRVGKGANKKLLSRTLVDAQRLKADADRWTFQAGQRRVDLRNTAGYRRTVHTTWDEMKWIAGTIPSCLLSGPAGLVHLTRAKWWPAGEIRKATAQVRSALDAIATSGAVRVESPGMRRASNLSAMKDELYDYPAVRNHLGVAQASLNVEVT